LIEGGSPLAISYACNLVRACLLSDAPLCSYNSFLLSVEALRRSPVESHKNIASAVEFGLGQKMAQLAENEGAVAESDFQSIKEQIIAVYKEWIQLYGHPASNERNQLNYVVLLQSNNLLVKKNITAMFLRVAIEATIEAYMQSSSLGASSAAAYQTVDALARLLVLIILHQPDEPNSEPFSGRKKLINTIFVVIPLVIAHNHEQNRTSFNQKPFFRLFSSMLYGFSVNKEALEPIELSLFSAIG
jgi:CCR4-NOT transcription complex subunit 1